MKKSEINAKAVEKVIKMFLPRDGDFLGFPENEVIQGPNDRSCFGFDNFFPKKWLIEDYGKNKINSIHGMNITSQYATYDLGLLENVSFCPKCGRKLSEVSENE